MGCCYCCESEEQKADLILAKFPVVTLDQLQFSLKPQLTTGRIVQAINTVISPISGKECIYYKVICEEEEERVVTSTDGDGNEVRRTETYWVFRFDEVVALDFFLCDPSRGSHYLYIPASNAPVKEFGVYSGNQGPTMKSFFTGSYDPSIDAMLSRHGFRGTRGLRFTESIISLYDQVVFLSIVKKSEIDQSLYAEPIPENCLTDQYFQDNNWSNWEKKAWHDIFRTSCMIVTNNPSTFQGVNIPSIFSYPPFLPVLTAPRVFVGYPVFQNPYGSSGYPMVIGGQPNYSVGMPMSPPLQQVYPAGQPVYPAVQAAYPTGQVVYSPGQSAYSPGQPAYPIQQQKYSSAQQIYPEQPIESSDQKIQGYPQYNTTNQPIPSSYQQHQIPQPIPVNSDGYPMQPGYNNPPGY